VLVGEAIADVATRVPAFPAPARAELDTWISRF
jgi:hypothetical protein